MTCGVGAQVVKQQLVRTDNRLLVTGAKNTQEGFTLLEILVVLMIVAIMAALVVMNLPGKSSQVAFNSEVNRVIVILNNLQDAAVYQDRLISCTPDNQSLSCSSYQDGKWQNFNIRSEINSLWPDDIYIIKVSDQSSALPFYEQKLASGQNSSIKLTFTPYNSLSAISVLLSNGRLNATLERTAVGYFKQVK